MVFGKQVNLEMIRANQIIEKQSRRELALHFGEVGMLGGFKQIALTKLDFLSSDRASDK